jgi:putative DNA primase/helicase
MGFFARFLVSWPASTQGTRAYQEPAAMTHLEGFRARILRLLELPIPIQEDGTLKPATAFLGVEAKQEWIAFHDAVESELRDGGELRDIRDVASKAAENAARLAALFQCYEADPTANGFEVTAENFVRASRIVAWHLSESRRLFGELAQPDDISAAVKLDGWLIEYCKSQQCLSVPRNRVRQSGPRQLRDGKRLDAALKVLTDMDRVRLTRRGKQTLIELNPALIGERRP